MTRFVSYVRVSTAGQGRSGLGLEAQREAVARHVAGAEGRIVAEFVEVEGGKRSDRPQLAAALAECRRHRAVLLIAKLDRLARKVHFIAGLMESGVPFVACDIPNATPFMLHIHAAVAEEEGRAISAAWIPGLRPSAVGPRPCGSETELPVLYQGHAGRSASGGAAFLGHDGVRRGAEAHAVHSAPRWKEDGEFRPRRAGDPPGRQPSVAPAPGLDCHAGPDGWTLPRTAPGIRGMSA